MHVSFQLIIIQNQANVLISRKRKHPCFAATGMNEAYLSMQQVTFFLLSTYSKTIMQMVLEFGVVVYIKQTF